MKPAQPSHNPIMNGAEMIAKLVSLANGTSSPAAEITALCLLASRKDATLVDKRRFAALRVYFETVPVDGPDGKTHKLKTLQRQYLRYVLVERFKQAGNTWDASYQMASDYLVAGSPVSASTVRDSHAAMKKLLKHPKMPTFCKGPDYEYSVAMAGDGKPTPATYVDPDFFIPDKHS